MGFDNMRHARMSNQLIYCCKEELVEIYKYALHAIRPDRLVKNALKFDGDDLIIHDVTSPGRPASIHSVKKRRLHVIGGGKCSLAMAKGLAEMANLGEVTQLFSHGCLSVPINSRSSYGADTELQSLLGSIQVECKFGAENNLPDEASVSATESILDCVVEACRADRALGLKPLFIALISGGGSACLSSPQHISLAEKTRVISDLVQKGADIVEINKVRRCFSRVKGGNLARHISNNDPEAEILSLIISDVIGDPVEFIASGPTFIREENESSREVMAKILHDYGINYLEVENESFDRLNEITGNGIVANIIIGNNEIALRAARAKATDLKYETVTLGNNLSGCTSVILDRLVQSSRVESSSKVLVMAGGEATVERLSDETWGTGGRTQEMAIDYMISRLSNKLPVSQNLVDIFLAGSTDGQDGPTDVSGCLASYADWLSDQPFDLGDVYSAKKSHDSYNFWKRHRPAWLLKFGATGTNVMDLYFLSLVKSIQ